ncbi:ROK family protein [Streptomyces sp. NPDC048845]|uniref:ROK family transcriptional regulator n=1 Tax=Streptomyces sp. NPDC048845 TaxID=3155390 RepID=UPI00342FF94B
MAHRTATPRTARAINDRIALELLVERGPLTAPQLQGITGLSRPTVAEIVKRLGDAGLIEVTGRTGDHRRGPNARVYALAAGRAHVAARGRGGEIRVADLGGRTVVSVGSPGELDAALHAAGVPVLHTAALAGPDPEVRRAFARRASTVVVESEANLAGLAEHRRGAARDRRDFALLWLGARTDAALVLDGRLRRGASGGAGAIGGLRLPGGESDFQSLLGGPSVRALARRHGLAGPAAAGGSRGAAFWAELAQRAAAGAAVLAAVLDPGCIVLGGEAGRAGGEYLAGLVRSRLAGMSPVPTEVRPAAGGPGAVLEGALQLALDTARAEIFGGVPRQRTALKS